MKFFSNSKWSTSQERQPNNNLLRNDLIQEVLNDQAIRKNDKVHGRKPQKLSLNIHERSIINNVSHVPNKVIYNFSNYHLADSGKSLLIRGLN